MNLEDKADILKCIELHTEVTTEEIERVCETLAKVFRSKDDANSASYNAIGSAVHEFCKSFGYKTVFN